MRKLYSLLTFFFLASATFAAMHTINISGFTYNPSSLTAAVGDQVTFNINANHPTVEVSQATWTADGTTPLSGGFGTKTSTFTITLTTVGDIYYVCSNHVSSSGMKGKITIIPTGINSLEPLTGIFLSPTVSASGKEINLINNSGQRQEGTLFVFNMLGSIVFSTEFSTAVKQAFTLNLPPGTYFYKLKNSLAITKGKRIMIVD